MERYNVLYDIMIFLRTSGKWKNCFSGLFLSKIKINLVEMLLICPSANPPLRKSVSWNCEVLVLATW